jgi:zinc transporter ZupT
MIYHGCSNVFGVYIYDKALSIYLKISNEKVQKARQRSTKHTHKTKDQVTQTTLKICIHRFVATIVRKNKKDIRIELYVVVY